MDFDLDTFTQRLRDLMYNQFPIDNAKHDSKHKGKPHMRDGAFRNNPTINLGNSRIFEIGNPTAEATIPHYHILENAEVIRKKGKGTKKSKGSQALISKLEDRDYEKVSFNGKTYSKEYDRNRRGKRSLVGSATRYITDYNGDRYKINRDANYYVNIHYHYIEKMLENSIIDTLARDFNMTTKGISYTGLKEEYEMVEIENLNMMGEE